PTMLKGAAPTGPGYRLDPAHANRLLFTPLGATLDRPGLMPNFPSVAPGLALTLTGPVPSHPAIGQPLNSVATAGAIGDMRAMDGRNALAALGAVDLNRPLADYRDLT